MQKAYLKSAILCIMLLMYLLWFSRYNMLYKMSV